MSLLGSTLTASTVVLAASAVRREKGYLADAAVAASLLAYRIGFGSAMEATESISHRTFDGLLYQADRSLGLDPFAWIQFVAAHRTLYDFLMNVYIMLPLMLALSWVMDRSKVMLKAAALSGALAWVIYNLVPGVGPLRAFSGVGGEHILLSAAAVAGFPRNAFPSMHLTWALIIALNSKHRFWRFAALAFVILTVMATVGLGEHYCVDLIAAVPFTLGVQYLAEFKLSAAPAAERRTA